MITLVFSISGLLLYFIFYSCSECFKHFKQGETVIEKIMALSALILIIAATIKILMMAFS